MSKIFVWLGLVVGAAALADVLAHPAGTTAAAGGVSDILTPSLQAVSGQSVAGAKTT